MAKTVSEFPKSRRTRAETYPWTQWLDGQVWELEQGEDFKPKPSVFRNTVTQAALRRGLKVRTRLLEGSLVIQAFDPLTEPVVAPQEDEVSEDEVPENELQAV